MKGNDYRDLIAEYIAVNYTSAGILVYTEVSLGKTIIGKDRRVDVFIHHKTERVALAIECKFQDVQGTTDEKIPYALRDLEATRVPGCLAYAGNGWSHGILHTLEASPLAAYCLPNSQRSSRTKYTRELDHVIAATFGLWERIIPKRRLFSAGVSS